MPKILTEHVIPLRDARALVPTSPTVHTIRRWTTDGDLESARVGGRIVTSKEAVARFLERCNQK